MCCDVQAQTIAAQSDKRQRQFDKSIDEWKRKVTDLQASVTAMRHIYSSIKPLLATLVVHVEQLVCLVFKQ